jgi:hypothetical protein
VRDQGSHPSSRDRLTINAPVHSHRDTATMEFRTDFR